MCPCPNLQPEFESIEVGPEDPVLIFGSLVLELRTVVLKLMPMSSTLELGNLETGVVARTRACIDGYGPKCRGLRHWHWGPGLGLNGMGIRISSSSSMNSCPSTGDLVLNAGDSGMSVYLPMPKYGVPDPSVDI